jgi:hypothetical protein
VPRRAPCPVNMVDLGLEGGLADCAEVVLIPLMLTERGERAKIQNEIVDEKHDAAPTIRWWGTLYEHATLNGLEKVRDEAVLYIANVGRGSAGASHWGDAKLRWLHRTDHASFVAHHPLANDPHPTFPPRARAGFLRPRRLRWLECDSLREGRVGSD